MTPGDLSRARTIALVRGMRAHKLASRRRRLPRQIYPHAIERDYGHALAAIVSTEKVRAAFAPLLSELPQLLASAKASRSLDHADADEGKRARQLIEQGKAALQKAISQPQIEAIAQKFAEQTSTYQRVQFNRQTRAALGVDVFTNDRPLRNAISNFTAENTALITNLAPRTAIAVDHMVTRAISTGTLHQDLALDLDREFGFGERRSALIARDQVGKFYGQTNAIRQQEIGIEKFIWRTVGDERVRDEHDELDGETFSYDDPPDEGLPGEPILCRCTAEPVFDDLLADIDAG